MHDLDWKPDKNLDEPLYEQIKQFVIRKISCGEWFLGFQLPPQRELALYFGVNRSTLKTALEDLTADGILGTRGKSGTYVRNNTWSLFRKPLSPDWLKYIRSGSLSPNREITRSIHDHEFSSNLIRLSTGELSPDYLPRNSTDRVLENLIAGGYSLGYDHPNGTIELRESLVQYYRRLGVEAKPTQILIVSGALQAIHLISVGLFPKGASVSCETPSYLYSLNLFKSSGINLCGVPCNGEGLDIARLVNIHKRGSTASHYTIPYFNNPTGHRLSDRKRIELMETYRKLRIPVIEDDTYRELYYDEERPLPLKASDESQFVIHVGSISKTLCAGLRVGWIIGQEEVIRKLADLKMQIDYGTSSLSQLVLDSLLRSGRFEENLSKLRQTLRAKRDLMHEILKEGFTGFSEWMKPSGGFYIWLRLKNRADIKSVFEYCRCHGVLINPGYMYDPKNRDAIRLSFSYVSEEEMKHGLSVLKDAILSNIPRTL